MSLMELFSNPDTMHSLSFSEKMAGSAVTMLMGMGITFCVLILLWAFVAIMGKFMSVTTKGDKASKKETEAAATPSVAAPAKASNTDETLAAVIAAAIAAYQNEGGSGHLVVKKIKRISGEMTSWSNAAIEDCIESRRF